MGIYPLSEIVKLGMELEISFHPNTSGTHVPIPVNQVPILFLLTKFKNKVPISC